jgi:hypothetical protein
VPILATKNVSLKPCSGFKTCIAVVRGAGLIISRYLADTTSSTVQPFLFVSAEFLTPFPPNFKVGGKESKEKGGEFLACAYPSMLAQKEETDKKKATGGKRER